MDGKPAIWHTRTREAKFRPHFGGAAEPHEQASVEVPSKGDLRSKKVDCDLLQRQRKVVIAQGGAKIWLLNVSLAQGPPQFPTAVL